MQLMSKDFLNVSDWKNSNLITGLRVFHTPTDILLPFSQQGDEEPLIVIDGFWGVDIRIPEWGGNIGGNWIDDEMLGEVWDCKLDWQEAFLTRPDKRGQSLEVEPTTTPYFLPLQKRVLLWILVDVMSSLGCYNKIDLTFLSSRVRSGLKEMWGIVTVEAYWPVWKLSC